MIILSALGIGLAQAGLPSRSIRSLIMICAGASAGMNFAAASPGSWRSVAAYVSAPVLLAVIADRVIAVIRQHVLPLDTGSAWAPLGRGTLAGLRLAGVVALYLLRATVAPSSTLRGLRQMLLDAVPVPGTTGAGQVRDEPSPFPVAQPADQPATRFPTKKAAFLSYYRRHPEYGNRPAAGRIAAELAPRAGLQGGTGRTYIAEELRRLHQLEAGPERAAAGDDQPAG